MKVSKHFQTALITILTVSLALTMGFVEHERASICPQDVYKAPVHHIVPILTPQLKTERQNTHSKRIATDATSTPTTSLPSQGQKDSTQQVCVNSYEIHKIELNTDKISQSSYLEMCYDDMLAIVYHESRFNNTAIGDGGKSWGPFQIYTTVHQEVTWDQATNYEWAATWTLKRLTANGYPVMRSHAIKSHNGLSGNGAYETAVKATSDRFLAMGL